MAGAPISWASRKQSVAALSTMEAEYIAAAAAAQEALSLHSLLWELGFSLKPVQLGIDIRLRTARNLSRQAHRHPLPLHA